MDVNVHFHSVTNIQASVHIALWALVVSAKTVARQVIKTPHYCHLTKEKRTEIRSIITRLTGNWNTNLREDKNHTSAPCSDVLSWLAVARVGNVVEYKTVVDQNVTQTMTSHLHFRRAHKKSSAI